MTEVANEGRQLLLSMLLDYGSNKIREQGMEF